VDRATENSRRQHTELRRHADELLAALDVDGAFDGQLVQRALSRMNGVLKVHVAMEIEGLYPRLLNHDDDDVRRLAQTMIDKLKGTYEGFFQFRSNWHADAVDADRDKFVAQARFVAKAFHDSTHQEELRLYDKVDAIFAAMRGE
jgi:hypothetical protein